MEEIYYVYYGFIAFIVSLMLGIIGMTSASWFFLILAPPLFIIGSLFAVTSLIAWYIHRNDPESKVGRDPNWVAILLGAFIIFGFYLMPGNACQSSWIDDEIDNYFRLHEFLYQFNACLQ